MPIEGHRTVIWFFKFLVTCYFSGMATLIFVTVVSDIVGPAGFDPTSSTSVWLYVAALGLVWSPLIFRYLK